MRYILAVVLAIATTSCNEHVSFTKGIVVSEERSFVGVSVTVDTTFDGNPDMHAFVIGSDILVSYSKGDSVLIDIHKQEVYAEPLTKKSKQSHEEE